MRTGRRKNSGPWRRSQWVRWRHTLILFARELDGQGFGSTWSRPANSGRGQVQSLAADRGHCRGVYH